MADRTNRLIRELEVALLQVRELQKELGSVRKPVTQDKWGFRVRFLAALYASRGTVRTAAKSVRRSHTTCYRQRQGDLLFRDLWSWVKDLAEQSDEQRPDWCSVFPSRLPEELRARLRAVGVTDEDRNP